MAQLLKVNNRDRQIELAPRIAKRRIVKLGWTKVTASIVGRAHALPRHADEIGVHLAIGVLVMEYRDRVSSGGNGGEFADSAAIRDARPGLRDGFIAILGKILGGRKQGTQDLAFVVAQSADLNVNDIRRCRYRLRQE